MFVPILQPTGTRYQVYICHISYIIHLTVPYPSNLLLYTWYSTPNTNIRTFIPTYAYTHTYILYPRPRPRATLSVRSRVTNIGFQYFKKFGLQDFTLEDFPDWSWRLSCGVLPQTSLRSHTLILPHSWPSTSMAHYRQQHPVNHNAAQVARTKPSQYDRLSTKNNGTNTMFFVTVAWRQQWHCWQSSSINPLLQHNRTSVRECRNKTIVGNRSHRVVFTPPGI